VIVGAVIGFGGRSLEKVLTVEEVGSSAVSCVTWGRGGCNLLRRARQREEIVCRSCRLFRGGFGRVRGCYRKCSAREIITDVVISGFANVG
jgi:hypothetical protein